MHALSFGGLGADVLARAAGHSERVQKAALATLSSYSCAELDPALHVQEVVRAVVGAPSQRGTFFARDERRGALPPETFIVTGYDRTLHSSKGVAVGQYVRERCGEYKNATTGAMLVCGAAEWVLSDVDGIELFKRAATGTEWREGWTGIEFAPWATQIRARGAGTALSKNLHRHYPSCCKSAAGCFGCRFGSPWGHDVGCARVVQMYDIEVDEEECDEFGHEEDEARVEEGGWSKLSTGDAEFDRRLRDVAEEDSNSTEAMHCRHCKNTQSVRVKNIDFKAGPPSAAPLHPNADDRVLSYEMQRRCIGVEGGAECAEVVKELTQMRGADASYQRIARRFRAQGGAIPKLPELQELLNEPRAGRTEEETVANDGRMVEYAKAVYEECMMGPEHHAYVRPEVHDEMVRALAVAAAPPSRDPDVAKERVAKVKELRKVVRMVATTLKCANSKLVAYNGVLSYCAGCNTAPVMLGAGLAARVALQYMVKYLSKDQVDLRSSLSVLADNRTPPPLPPSLAPSRLGSTRTQCAPRPPVLPTPVPASLV